MKRVLLSVCLISLALFYASAQKADKDSIALIKFEKALADIEAKDFVIIVDSYKVSDTINAEDGILKQIPITHNLSLTKRSSCFFRDRSLQIMPIRTN